MSKPCGDLIRLDCEGKVRASSEVAHGCFASILGKEPRGGLALVRRYSYTVRQGGIRGSMIHVERREGLQEGIWAHHDLNIIVGLLDEMDHLIS